MNAEEQAVAAVLERYSEAANRSDLDGVVALYSDDGVLMAQESQPAVGIEAVRGAYEAIFTAVSLDIAFSIAEVRVLSAEWAFIRSTSTGTITIKADSASMPEGNQELFLFSKVGGTWKIARYAFSVTSPARA